MAPLASRRFTRVQQGDWDRPTFSASSAIVSRPLLRSAERIFRSIWSSAGALPSDRNSDGLFCLPAFLRDFILHAKQMAQTSARFSVSPQIDSPEDNDF